MSIRSTAISLALVIANYQPILAQEIASPLTPPAFSSPISAKPQAKQFRLRHLQISGNTHTKYIVIRRMIPLNEGDIFNQVLWDFGLEQINRSGLFEPIQPGDVEIKPDEATGFVDVELRLKERDRQRIDFNGGGGTTGGGSIGLDYSNINLTGRGDRLIGRVRVGTRERSAEAALSSMLYRKLPLSFDLGGFYQRLEFVNASVSSGREPLFVQRSGGLNLGIFLPLDRSRYTITSKTRVGVVYSLTSTNLADTLLLATGSQSTLTQKGLRTGTLTPLLLHNTLDREFDPNRGERFTLGAEVGARALGGGLNTLKPYFDYRRFFSVGENKLSESAEPMAFGFRIRASHIRAFGEPLSEQALSTVRGVPVFRRFFPGGETELRGYDVNSVAPLARVERFIIPESGEPILLSSEVRPVGGDTQLLFNAEYRVPIVWRLSTAAFVDVGGSFNARRLVAEVFQTMSQIQSTGAPVTVRTVLTPLTPERDILPRYRASLGGELRFPIPVVNIPFRLIFSWNPNAQKVPPDGSLLAPEKRFAFRVGFSRTL